MTALLITALLALPGDAEGLAKPEEWPVIFTVSILTNLSWQVEPDLRHAALGNVSYDWTQQAQRVDHGAGNFECAHFYKSTSGCSLIMNSNGTYRLLPQPVPAGEPECCLDIPTIFAPPPNWAANGSPTSGGVDVLVPYVGDSTLAFLYPESGKCNVRGSGNNSGCHSYYDIEGIGYTAQPILFTFPANFGLQDWYFLRTTMAVQLAPLPKSRFELPAGCATTLCPKSSARSRGTRHAMPWML